jgi:hypothetical protein
MISAMLSRTMIRHRWLTRFASAFVASALASLAIDGRVELASGLYAIAVMVGFLISDILTRRAGGTGSR